MLLTPPSAETQRCRVRGPRQLDEVAARYGLSPVIWETVRLLSLGVPVPGERHPFGRPSRPTPGHTVPEPALLRDWLRQRLPVQMIPHAYVVLGQLPTTTTRKVDWRALAEPRFHTTEHTPARDSTEHEIITIWQHVLGRADLTLADEVRGAQATRPDVPAAAASTTDA